MHWMWLQGFLSWNITFLVVCCIALSKNAVLAIASIFKIWLFTCSRRYWFRWSYFPLNLCIHLYILLANPRALCSTVSHPKVVGVGSSSPFLYVFASDVRLSTVPLVQNNSLKEISRIIQDIIFKFGTQN